MTKQALVLTNREAGAAIPAWAQVLDECGFSVLSCNIFKDKSKNSGSPAADILLLDLFETEESEISDLIDQAVRQCEEMGFAQSRIPMVAIAGPSLRLNEEQMAHFSDLLQPPLTQDMIANRLVSLMRLATMRREAERRSLTFKKFGVGLPMVPPPYNLDEQRLLYLGAGMAFLPIQVALPDETETFAALSPAMAELYLDEGDFDVLVVELSDYNEHLVAFIASLRRNPSYFSLPVILVCHKKATEDGLAGLAAGANDIVSFPFSEQFFENRMGILVREERYRRQLKKIFTEARLLMPTDEVTRLYSEAFFKAHLAGMQESGASSVASFAGIDIGIDDVENNERDSSSAKGLEPGLLSRVSRMISSLMRAEDMLTRLDNGHLVAFFPDTDLSEARTALQRIRAIVQLSPFVEQNSNRGVNVSLDFSLHSCDVAQPSVNIDKILKDLFENPVTRF